MFEGLKDWWERRRALRDLRENEKNSSRDFDGFFHEQIGFAKGALENGVRDKALLTWREMRASFPDLFMTSERALDLTLKLELYDEADALIEEGRQRYPRFRGLHAGVYARTAFLRGNLDQAMSRCEVLRRKMPRVADGYLVAAECLSKLGREEEAEAMFRLGTRKIPTSALLYVRYAQCATRRRDWPAALRRFEVISKRFDAAEGPLGSAQSLKELGRFDEAEDILTKLTEREPFFPWGFAGLADLADVRGDINEAADRWAAIVRRLPFFHHAYLMGAAAMRKAGRDDEADELLRVTVVRSPSDLAVNLEFARSADRRKDWAAAARRWAVVREKFPDCEEARVREAEAVQASEQQGTANDAR